MKRILKCIILLVVVCSLTTGCNQGGNQDTPVTPKGDSVNKVSPVPQAEQVFGGKLDTLWIDSLGFDTVPKKKLLFAFTFVQPDKLTIHGWSKRRIIGREFDDPPNLKLLNGRPSAFDYGLGTYFSDLVLTEKEVKDIRQVFFDNHAKFVLFAPDKRGEHIYYNVFVSVDDPLALNKTHLAIPTNTFANPSPPKNQ